MPKLTNGQVPKLCQSERYAVVYANGQKIRLGKWDNATAQPTESSLKAYARFVAEWVVSPLVAGRSRQEGATINELARAFLNEKRETVLKNDYVSYEIALATVLQLYDGIPADFFSPKSLKAVRNVFVERGYTRGYCNKLCTMIKTAFRWGVAEELVKAETLESLRSVPALEAGRTTAPEGKGRTAVHDETVEATLPYLTPTVAAMVRIQRITAMCPCEVCRMTPGQIDRSSEIWYYRPVKHKGAWRNHERCIPLGITSQNILAPYLISKGDDDAIFSPITSMSERNQRLASERKSKVTPSQIKRHEAAMKRTRKKPLQKFWNTVSYACSIRSAIKTANNNLPKEERIKHWTPYQLRHAAITHIVATEGLDVARAVAGQKTINVTQHYNHSARKVATDYVLKQESQKQEKNIAQD